MSFAGSHGVGVPRQRYSLARSRRELAHDECPEVTSRNKRRPFSLAHGCRVPSATVRSEGHAMDRAGGVRDRGAGLELDTPSRRCRCARTDAAVRRAPSGTGRSRAGPETLASLCRRGTAFVQPTSFLVGTVQTDAPRRYPWQRGVPVPFPAGARDSASREGCPPFLGKSLIPR